jgi:hypothetical protein
MRVLRQRLERESGEFLNASELFTYQLEPDKNHLHQGDLIRRTEGVEKLLAEVHPHFSSGQYRYFLILTQSCDLVRRDNGSCKSPYITLSPVRPASVAIEREVAKHQRTDVEKRIGFVSEKAEPKVSQFLERFFNNNEPTYFFLHREHRAEMREHHCAFLQVSIAVKAQLHYETLLSAKVLQLSEAFEHKLGYLVGNIYSRVGTEDWPADRLSDLVREGKDSHRTIWIQPDIHSRAIKHLSTLSPEAQTIEALERFVEGVGQERLRKRKELLDIVEEKVKNILSDEERLKLRGRLDNDPKFRQLIK